MLKDKSFYNNKKVIVRVDYNVPINNGVIEDNNRIKMSLKTINYLIDAGAKVVLMSHLGKIKTEEDKKDKSLSIVCEELSRLLNKCVLFSKETRGKNLEMLIDSMKSGDVLLIENTRFESGETLCDEELSRYWASLGDSYVMDAFGSCHRLHASTYGIPSIIGGVRGFLVDEEVNKLNEVISNNEKVIIMGGSKVEDKLSLIENLIPRSKKIIIGGAMCFTFLKALGYNTGKSIVNEEKLGMCKNLLDRYRDKIILPIDIVTDNGLKDINDLSSLDTGFDIGNKTIEYFTSLIDKNDLVVMNGTMGKFEDDEYAYGTKEIFEYLNKNNIKVVLCGGDTASAAKKYNISFYFISTGGGASLEYLENSKFKVLEVLNE